MVRKAKRKSDGLVAAIKCINRTRLSHSDMDNLRREIDIMMTLQHPHVLSMIDVFADELREIHLVTQFVEVGNPVRARSIGTLAAWVDAASRLSLDREQKHRAQRPPHRRGFEVRTGLCCAGRLATCHTTTPFCTRTNQGGELFERILAKSSYSEAEARVVVRQLLGTLDFLHSCGVVHRDIKPENILLATNDDEKPHIVLADFGFAKHVTDQSGANVVCGTADYLAPEVLKRLQGRAASAHPALAAKADVWSAGVVVYILLSG